MNLNIIGGTIGGIILIALFIILSPFTIINTGNKGVIYNWGAISDKVLDEGFAWRLPIKQNIKEISIQPRQISYKIEVNKEGAITRDNQTIGAEITIFYNFNKEHLIPMLKGYGIEKIEQIIAKTVIENFKRSIGDYSIFDVAGRQEEIKEKIYGATRGDLASYPLNLSELKINNYDWSDLFDKQIEQTMEKAQQVKQAEQELLIVQQQAQKQVKQAEAEKQALITKAEGEKEAARLNAEAKALEGEGIKKYNQSIAVNIEQEIKLRQLAIELERIQKWNGQYVPSQVFTPIPLDLKPDWMGNK